VQGDSRSYAPVLAIDTLDTGRATELTNRLRTVNRVIAPVEMRAPWSEMRVRACSLTADRLARLRRADAVARRLSHESGYDSKVWQFPVILIPLGTAEAPDSVVLRPVDSVDGMTAQSVLMDDALLRKMCREILEIAGVARCSTI
jgi:GMP synthase (glutamine-hydrolysing)